jgi:hypothetical protein
MERLRESELSVSVCVGSVANIFTTEFTEGSWLMVQKTTIYISASS